MISKDRWSLVMGTMPDAAKSFPASNLDAGYFQYVHICLGFRDLHICGSSLNKH